MIINYQFHNIIIIIVISKVMNYVLGIVTNMLISTNNFFDICIYLYIV